MKNEYRVKEATHLSCNAENQPLPEADPSRAYKGLKEVYARIPDYKPTTQTVPEGLCIVLK